MHVNLQWDGLTPVWVANVRTGENNRHRWGCRATVSLMCGCGNAKWSSHSRARFYHFSPKVNIHLSYNLHSYSDVFTLQKWKRMLTWKSIQKNLQHFHSSDPKTGDNPFQQLNEWTKQWYLHTVGSYTTKRDELLWMRNVHELRWAH